MFELTDGGKTRGLGPPRPRLLAAAGLALLVAGVLGPPVAADEIYFKSGYSETAVIIRETEDSLRFKTDMGLSTISMGRIDFIEKASQEENRALLKKWREKELRLKETLEKRREAEKQFEDRQIAKGLIKFEEEWMTPEKRKEILDLRKRARRHRRRFETEQEAKGLVRFQHIWVTPEVADELSGMEQEIHRLHEEVATHNRTVETLRSVMLAISSINEADQFSERIEVVNESIAENTEKLNKLLKRADEIEAESVTYVMPEEFVDAVESEETYEELE